MKHLKLYEEATKGLTWDQLSQEAREKAIDNNRDINVDRDWWKDEIEFLKEELEDEGLDNVGIQFSGFYSQGDGASFSGFVSNHPRFLEIIGMKKLPKQVEDLLMTTFVRHSSRYSHAQTVETHVNWDTQDKFLTLYPFGPEVPMEYDLEKIGDEVYKLAEDWRLDRCAHIYSSLEREYDSLTSDESVEDTLLANDYEWDEEGNII